MLGGGQAARGGLWRVVLRARSTAVVCRAVFYGGLKVLWWHIKHPVMSTSTSRFRHS